ncbi:hypothetical protein A2482_00215 [Candidatus Falkowbacteria bacterium RIFOXYC2_FULL_48_21]|uniref:Uncharacterized protein n=1 Tax=Candidatus Falkowbacteria bacterium RIFOXYC2_FULL_48_21 TaxID=1798005 RepID=A0A1F5TCU6_9BACT|nr:MAG: hypothetical protein A2482_00215 [Candidatus Falkowbacteria bacterium RIFOXYC2_FULL_48_21]
MIKTGTGGNEHADLVVPVNESFMVMFLSGRLEIIMVSGTATCFCQSDFEKRRQIILVVPARDASRVPDVNDLIRAFPRLSAGRRLHEVRDIPIPYQDLLRLTGVHIENIMLPDRELIVLYANREPAHSVKFTEQILVGIQLKADALDEMLWPKEPEDYYIVGHETFSKSGVHNLLLLVKGGKEVVFSPTLTIQAELGDRGFRVWDRTLQPAEIH